MNNSNNDINFPKNADITEILGMEDKMSEMQNQLDNNATDTQKNFNRKVLELQSFLKNQYISRLYHIKQNTIADIYVKFQFLILEKRNKLL